MPKMTHSRLQKLEDWACHVHGRDETRKRSEPYARHVQDMQDLREVELVLHGALRVLDNERNFSFVKRAPGVRQRHAHGLVRRGARLDLPHLHGTGAAAAAAT
eukprot:91763-Pleurochrysis_carterae.AAC.1